MLDLIFSYIMKNVLRLVYIQLIKEKQKQKQTQWTFFKGDNSIIFCKILWEGKVII